MSSFESLAVFSTGVLISLPPSGVRLVPLSLLRVLLYTHGVFYRTINFGGRLILYCTSSLEVPFVWQSFMRDIFSHSGPCSSTWRCRKELRLTTFPHAISDFSSLCGDLNARTGLRPAHVGVVSTSLFNEEVIVGCWEVLFIIVKLFRDLSSCGEVL